MKQLLFVIFFVGVAHAVNITDYNWLIMKESNLNSNVTLHCYFNVPVDCQWKINDRLANINHRYKYVRSYGRGTYDCSIQIFHLMRKDYAVWTCDAPESKPKQTLVYLLRSRTDTYSTTILKDTDYVLLMKPFIRLPRQRVCVFNTMLDKCIYISLSSTDVVPSMTNIHEKHTNNCSQTTSPYFVSTSTTAALCGGLKEMHNTRMRNDSAQLVCNDITEPVNCTWRHNQEYVRIGKEIRYVQGDGTNTLDCSIEVSDTTPEEMMGHWECLDKDNSSILNVHRLAPVITPETEEEEDIEEWPTTLYRYYSYNYKTEIKQLIELLHSFLICVVLFLVLIIIKSILAAAIWFKNYRDQSPATEYKKIDSRYMMTNAQTNPTFDDKI